MPAARPQLSSFEIACRLACRIASRVYGPGGRIPTKREFCTEFSSSNMTVQKALSMLVEDGFLTTHGKAGTYVADVPPCFRRVGVLYPKALTESFWYRSLHEAFAAATARRSIPLLEYAGCEADRPVQERLADDLSMARLAGIVCTSPLMEWCEAARASRTPPPAEIVFSGTTQAGTMATMRLLHNAARMTSLVRAQGIQRLAIIATYMQTSHMEGIIRDLSSAGAAVPQEWLHYVDPRSHQTARGIAHLLMTLPAARRPEIVYIADDHLVTSATQGLADAGIPVRVIAHGNIPYTRPVHVPVTFYGFDVRRIAEDALDCLAGQMRGQPFAAEMLAEAGFFAQDGTPIAV